jgi:hypothetical protein
MASFQQRKYTVHFIKAEAPTVDGVVSVKEYYDAAQRQSGWVNLDVVPPRRDKEGTYFRALYNDEKIHFLISYRDADGLQTGLLSSGSEVMEIYIDPVLDDLNRTTQIDAVRNNRGYLLSIELSTQTISPTIHTASADGSLLFNDAWNPRNIETAITQRGDRITVEVAIPFASFNLPGSLDAPNSPRNGTSWAVQITRKSSNPLNRRPVWSYPQSYIASNRPWGIFLFERSESPVFVPPALPTSTPTPLRRRLPVDFVSIHSAPTFTPTPIPIKREGISDVQLRIEPRGWITNGKLVSFTANARSIDNNEAAARFRIPRLPIRLAADFVPQTLRLPGTSQLYIEPVEKIGNELNVSMYVELQSRMLAQNADASISTVSQEIIVHVDPKLDLPEPIPIRAETVPIHLLTDSTLDETVGSTVRIGGRLGAGGFARFGGLLEQLFPEVELIVHRGSAAPLYIKVPVQDDYHFLVAIPVENESMLNGLWWVKAQAVSPSFPSLIASSSGLVIPVGAFARNASNTVGKGIKSVRPHDLSQNVFSQFFGNIILVSGAGGSASEAASYDQIIRRIYENFVPGRRFTTDTAKVFSPRALPAKDTDPEINVLTPVTVSTLMNRIEAIPSTHAMTLLFIGVNNEDGNLLLSDGQILAAHDLGQQLNAVRREAATVVIVDAPRAEIAVRAILEAAGNNANLVGIASTGSTSLSIAIFGNLEGTGQPVSFTDYFFDQIIAGKPIGDAFHVARDQLLQIQGPIVLQNPAIHPGEIPTELLETTLGSAATGNLENDGVPDTLPPMILAAPGNQELPAGSRLDVEAWIIDESGGGSDLKVGIRLAPAVAGSNLPVVELPLGYDPDRNRFIASIHDFPESLFGPLENSAEFVLAIVAEDGRGNSASPAASLITVIPASAPAVDEMVRVEDSDLNVDGDVDLHDLLKLIELWQQPVDHDVNQDNILDARDLELLQFFWKQSVPIELQR